MSSIEMSLEVGPGLVCLGCVEPAITMVKIEDTAGLLDDDPVCSVNDLLVCEGSVAGLGIQLYVFDAAVEGLDGLVGIPFFVEVFGS
jgi:hypothetical protein